MICKYNWVMSKLNVASGGSCQPQCPTKTVLTMLCDGYLYFLCVGKVACCALGCMFSLEAMHTLQGDMVKIQLGSLWPIKLLLRVIPSSRCQMSMTCLGMLSCSFYIF